MLNNKTKNVSETMASTGPCLSCSDVEQSKPKYVLVNSGISVGCKIAQSKNVLINCDIFVRIQNNQIKNYTWMVL